MARNRRTISVRLDDEDERALRELLAALDVEYKGGRHRYQGERSPEMKLLDRVRGRHAAYGTLPEGQVVRWAVRYALDRYQAPRLTDPPG